MATRCKTVEFVFPTNQATLNAGNALASTSTTVYLPESSKVFKSVTLEIGCTDHVTAASSPTSFAMSIQLAAVTANSTTVTDTITDGGESLVYHVSRDATSYFTTNWSGSSMLATVSITVGTNATNNHFAKLKITYEYDDTSSTHVKTIWYPIETTRTLLTTSYQTIGGATAIPAIKGIDSILPEDGITIRQVWVELLGNQGTGSTTDFSLDVKLTTDATTLATLYRVEAALQTPGWLHAIWDITASALTAAQPFEAKVTGVTDRVPHLCGWVGITYEFTPATTERVWNSLLIPAFDGEDQQGASSSSGKALHVKDFWIAEPGAIVTQPSQVFAFYNDTQQGSAMSLWVTGQSARSFTTTATGATMVLSQRIDGGGTSSGGVQLDRGRNEVKVNEFHNASSAGAFSGINGFMIINYTSGKADDGVGVHNQTRHFALGWFQADANNITYSSPTAKTPTIPETDYFLNCLALQTTWMATADSHQAIRIQVQRTGTEGPGGDGAGWGNLYHGAIGSDAENWLRWTTDCLRHFRRWSGDVDAARMDLQTVRNWLFLNAGSAWVGTIGLLVTYHAITVTATGTVRGTAGDGSGLTVNISRSATSEKVLEAITGTGGGYQATWFDDTEPLIADVYEDETHVGRSAPFYAGE
jgi:hypothetical protein